MTEGAWNNLGLYFYALGGANNYASAEEAYRKAIGLRSDYASARLNLAVLHRARGADAAAIDGLYDAIAAGEPSPEGAILDWAVIYAVRGKTRQNREILERGTRALPESEVIARALAVSEYQTKDCRKAEEVLARFEAPTQSVETLNSLALIRVCLGRRDDAIQLFRRSLALQPGQQTVVQSLAVLEGGDGRRPGS